MDPVCRNLSRDSTAAFRRLTAKLKLRQRSKASLAGGTRRKTKSDNLVLETEQN